MFRDICRISRHDVSRCVSIEEKEENIRRSVSKVHPPDGVKVDFRGVSTYWENIAQNRNIRANIPSTSFLLYSGKIILPLSFYGMEAEKFESKIGETSILNSNGVCKERFSSEKNDISMKYRLSYVAPFFSSVPSRLSILENIHWIFEPLSRGMILKR